MKIYDIQVNHVQKPLGFDASSVVISWKADSSLSKKQASASIRVTREAPDGEEVYFREGPALDSLGHAARFVPAPRTRYYVAVSVTGDRNDSGTALSWFETGKMDEPWQGSWITPEKSSSPVKASWFPRAAERTFPEMQQEGWDGIWRVADYGPEHHPLIRKGFTLRDKPIKKARAYMTGMGAFYLYVNGNRIGDEYLAPGFTDYNSLLQASTLDVTDYLTSGANAVGVMLGKNWGRGRYGADNMGEGLYCDTYALLFELRVLYGDGSEETLVSDGSWLWNKGPVLDSGIYDGEVYDANAVIPHWADPLCDETGWRPMVLWESTLGRVVDRLSPPVRVQKTLPVKEILRTPGGATVIDLGQNIAGFLRLRIDVPKGTRVRLKMCEWLEDGEYYRGNLHNALAEYVFISGGKAEWIEPHFTFFGFRYALVENWEPAPENVIGCLLHSDMEQTGTITTSDPLLNRLFENALWSQRDNFIDIPTDCPQRSERQGWTGDAQVFSSTALFNTDCFAFYMKYMRDVYTEQKKDNGCVPDVVPDVRHTGKPGSEATLPTGACAWGDVATILPWNLYLYSGDKDLLRRFLPAMRSWVDYVMASGVDVRNKGGWLSGMHFGDWLALDGESENSPLGGTENEFLAAAYHLHSAELLADALEITGDIAEAVRYRTYASTLREEMRKEYYSAYGRPTMDTQTFYVITLQFHICREDHRPIMVEALAKRLVKDGMKLKTGFIGTPFLCRVLSDNGRSDLAWRLVMNRECPGWLYPVTMGATTIWERWNSILPDGHINRTHMNSLNHYSYGSIVEWMYRNMAGLNPLKEEPGFRRVALRPDLNRRVQSVRAEYDSPAGTYLSSWRIRPDNVVTYSCTIPFNVSAKLSLPFADASGITCLSKDAQACIFRQDGDRAVTSLPAGTYTFEYVPTRNFGESPYSEDTPIGSLLDDPAASRVLFDHSRLGAAPACPGYRPSMTLREACGLDFIGMPMSNDMEGLIDRLKEIPVSHKSDG